MFFIIRASIVQNIPKPFCNNSMPIKAAVPTSPHMSGSRDDWLGHSIKTVETIAALGDLAPFPFIHTAAKAVLVLLGTIQVRSIVDGLEILAHKESFHRKPSKTEMPSKT